MEFDIQVKGLKEIHAALKKLPEEMARKALEDGLKAGGKVIQKEARRRAPRRSGLLKRSIVVRKYRKDKNSVRYVVAVAGKAFYAHMVEYGTKAHFINAKKGNEKGLFFRRGSKRVIVKYVRHPGANDKPFMRPAFDETRQEVIKTFGRVISQAIEKQARKAATK